MVRLNAAALFLVLIRWLRPQVICDVGSADARHAERFAALVPHARVVAFEASPVNIEFVRRNAAVRSGGVEAVQTAVTDADGIATFHIPDGSPNTCALPSWGDLGRQSSLLDRAHDFVRMREVAVPTVRLDTFFSRSDPVENSIALWIDVEGAAYQVLEGILGVCRRVQVVHVEVEEQPLWHGQRLRGDIESLMRRMGFRALARGVRRAQYDIVFVAERLLRSRPVMVRASVLCAAAFTFAQRAFGEGLRRVLRRCCRAYKQID
jgi:FkbM family methyltransferase